MIIASRNILAPNNVRFTPHNMSLMFKEYKENYKNENNETFKDNCYIAITLGVIDNKQLPDIDDCLLLIKGLNNWCTLEQAEIIYNSFITAYPERGTLGCFCDLCKILCQDQPFATQVTDMVETLEDKVIQYFESRKKIEDLKNKLMSGLNKIQDTGDIKDIASKIKEATKDIVTENKEATETIENK